MRVRPVNSYQLISPRLTEITLVQTFASQLCPLARVQLSLTVISSHPRLTRPLDTSKVEKLHTTDLFIVVHPEILNIFLLFVQ